MIYSHFLELPTYLEIPLIDFCETLHNGRQAPKVCAVKVFPNFRSMRAEIRCKAKTIHRIHKWRTRGKKLVPSHESEALEDKQKLQMKTFSETCRVFSTDST